VGGGSRPGQLNRTLDEHGDALFDFALAVTGDSERATEAVCQAVPAAVFALGPNVGQAALLGAVLDAALDCAQPPGNPPGELFRPGPGSRDDLQHIARAATQALQPHQRGVLDLTLRQGLDGQGLSVALGVSPGLVSSTTQAAVDKAEQVIGAVLLARLGQEDCHGLVEVLHDPAVVDSGRWTAAVNKHIEECPTCGDRRRALVPVTSLLASMPATPAPPELRRRLLHGGRAGPTPVERHKASRRRFVRGTPPRPRAFRGTPPRPRGRRHLPTGRARGALAAGLVAVVVAGSVSLALAARRRSGQRPAGAAPAGRLALRTGPLDFGASDVNSSIEVANTGRRPLHFTVRPGAPWLRAVTGEGTVAPGQQLMVGVAVDRSTAPEGDSTSEFRVRSTGGSGVIPVRAGGVERPPGLSGLEATPKVVARMGCPGSTPAQARAMVVEESGIRHVEVHWRGPDQFEQMADMTGAGPSLFVGSFGPFPTAGDVDWWVSATDIRENSTISTPESLRVSGC
jgi:hypothetical protein